MIQKAWILLFGILLSQVVYSGDCKPGGCSGQLCTDKEGMMSTCEWRPEYDCIKLQKCERQPSGQCGWTETEESKKCFVKSSAGVASPATTVQVVEPKVRDSKQKKAAGKKKKD